MRIGIVAITAGMAACLTLSCAQPDCADFFGTASAADVRACLLAGADPGAKAEGGETPLHIAAQEGHAGAIAALLDGGSDPDARLESGDTPLHRAAGQGHGAAIAALLDAGADPKARASGLTPFDRIGEDSPLTGTPAYWRLNDARWN